MISYEFEGHDLTDWAEFGGLPVWVNHSCMNGPYEARVYSSSPDEGLWNVWWWNPINLNSKVKACVSQIAIKYSTLEDVIGDRPEWATSFVVHADGTAAWRLRTSISTRLDDIKGHLFDPSVYAEPVKLEEIEKNDIRS